MTAMFSGADLLGAITVATKLKEPVKLIRWQVDKAHVMLVENLRFPVIETPTAYPSIPAKALKSVALRKGSLYTLETDEADDTVSIRDLPTDNVFRIPAGPAFDTYDGERILDKVEAEGRATVILNDVSSIYQMLRMANKDEGVRFVYDSGYLTVTTCDTRLEVMLKVQSEAKAYYETVLPASYVLMVLSMQDRIKDGEQILPTIQLGNGVPASFRIILKGRIWHFLIAARIEASHD